MIDLERAKILVSATIRVAFERYKASWIEWNESRLSPDRSPPRLVRGTESGSDERGNRATLCACSVSLPSVGSDLSLCHRLRFSLPPPSLPPFLPPSHSLALLPRLESHAYAATNVRGVNPRELPGLRSVAASLMIAPSRALPFCLALSLSLPPSPSPCFAISSLSSSVAPSPPENAFRDPKPRENARSFARLLLLAAVSPCRMADETFGFKKIYKRVRESNFSIESNHRR